MGSSYVGIGTLCTPAESILSARAESSRLRTALVVRDTPQHLAQFVQVLVYGSYGYDTNLLALRAPGALAHRVLGGERHSPAFGSIRTGACVR